MQDSDTRPLGAGTSLAYSVSMDCQLFLPDHVEKVLEFEKNQNSHLGDGLKFEMHSWDQPWRKESLIHYASLGWSFVATEDQKLLGYVLAQPFLYFNNWTQVVWVENLSSQNSEISDQLMDVLIRWSKSKHMQKVILNNERDWAPSLASEDSRWKEGTFFHLSTTKLEES
ncbi:MAG: hypothetical protein AAF203_01140 [Pseudomonadota bacterium]